MNFDCVCLCMFSRFPRHSICDNNDEWTGALIFPSKIKMFYITYWLISYFLFLFFRKCIPSFFIAHSIIIKFDDNDLFKLIANQTNSESCYTGLFIMQSHVGSCRQILQRWRYNLEYWNCCYIISRLADEESGTRHYRWLPINMRHIRPSPICNLFRDNGGQF